MMKLSKKLWLFAMPMFIASNLFSQGFVENALLFSRTKSGGSARVQALGGAQIALGGDFSSALANPAGLGMYNRNEITFSPALNFYQTDAEHLGKTSSNSKGVFNIHELSYVHNMPEDKNGFLGGSFGISMTRVNDFNGFIRYQGNDNASSVVDYFIEDATGTTADNLGGVLTSLGYDNYLIQDSVVYGGADTDYFSVMGTYPDDPTDIRNLKRTGLVKVRGAQYQFSFAYGGNFQDKLFFGANLGITTLRYRFQSTYRESNFSFDLSPGYDPLDLIQIKDQVIIDGTGVNLTLGLIYRPANFFQVGMSFVTPTYYQLTDTYTARISTQWNDFDYLDQGEILSSISSELDEPLISEYSITTPMKFSTGAAFFIGKYGFITGDVEFVNYTKAKYDSNTPDVSFNPENNDIKNFYTNVINYRFGAEFRYDIFRLRGGFNVQNNPYKKEFDVDQKISTYSAGAGIKYSKFYVDVAVLTSKWNSSYSQYVMQNGQGPVVRLKNKMTSGMITVGFTF